MRRALELSPEDTHALALAALNVVTSVSPEVLARCRREGRRSARPGVRPEDLAALADALDAALPGVVARVRAL